MGFFSNAFNWLKQNVFHPIGNYIDTNYIKPFKNEGFLKGGVHVFSNIAGDIAKVSSKVGDVARAVGSFGVPVAGVVGSVADSIANGAGTASVVGNEVYKGIK